MNGCTVYTLQWTDSLSGITCKFKIWMLGCFFSVGLFGWSHLSICPRSPGKQSGRVTSGKQSGPRRWVPWAETVGTVGRDGGYRGPRRWVLWGRDGGYRGAETVGSDRGAETVGTVGPRRWVPWGRDGGYCGAETVGTVGRDGGYRGGRDGGYRGPRRWVLGPRRWAETVGTVGPRRWVLWGRDGGYRGAETVGTVGPRRWVPWAETVGTVGRDGGYRGPGRDGGYCGPRRRYLLSNHKTTTSVCVFEEAEQCRWAMGEQGSKAHTGGKSSAHSHLLSGGGGGGEGETLHLGLEKPDRRVEG